MKTIMIRGLQDEIHKELKKLCADKEITINDFLIALIEKEVKKK
ncbi:unnamed protein product [marine sediment metagenome]|uniref:Uncharacterized protein n=1 Tax=marine sediment metagenome TaxID=412755 RepID=X1D4Y9_9ZZZZ